MASKHHPSVEGGDNERVVASAAVRKYVERVENVAEEIKALSQDRKEIYTEAKAAGYDAATIRFWVSERKKDKAKREQEWALRRLYGEALGEPDVFG